MSGEVNGNQRTDYVNPSYPYLKDLCEALGWQGGTIHQVVKEVARLRTDKRCVKCPECNLEFEIQGRGVK